MDFDAPIIVTGAAGFIGSRILIELNKLGFSQLILVDDNNKYNNEKFILSYPKIDKSAFFNWLNSTKIQPQFIFHIGAITDTTETNIEKLTKWNVDFSKQIWNYCTSHKIPLIYASSAATYGVGGLGYKDDETLIEKLKPLNPYGISKNEMDKWAIQQTSSPPFWAALKFFNVYGYNESYKNRMASMVYHGYNQIKTTGKVKLFCSHNPNFKDGEQLRDFIYVNDVVSVCLWLMKNKIKSGIYNLGTGISRTFNDMMISIFNTLQMPVNIEYIETPIDIRDKYQYYTEANMEKLKQAGYTTPFFSLEEGIDDYIQNYLAK